MLLIFMNGYITFLAFLFFKCCIQVVVILMTGLFGASLNFAPMAHASPASLSPFSASSFKQSFKIHRHVSPKLPFILHGQKHSLHLPKIEPVTQMSFCESSGPYPLCPSPGPTAIWKQRQPGPRSDEHHPPPSPSIAWWIGDEKGSQGCGLSFLPALLHFWRG